VEKASAKIKTLKLYPLTFNFYFILNYSHWATTYMKKINIEINQAKILAYEIKLNDDRPEVCATIGLFANDKQITTFTLRTEDYYGNSVQFELPFELISPIKEIAKELETILIREANKSLKQLTYTK
jgi:hypothetical protein